MMAAPRADFTVKRIDDKAEAEKLVDRMEEKRRYVVRETSTGRLYEVEMTWWDRDRMDQDALADADRYCERDQGLDPEADEFADCIDEYLDSVAGEEAVRLTKEGRWDGHVMTYVEAQYGAALFYRRTADGRKPGRAERHPLGRRMA